MAFSPETYALLAGKINGGGGSGGGSSCEVFPVNFTVEDGEVTEVDKTVSEIQEAVNGGKLIVGSCNGFIFYESSVDTTAGFYLYLEWVYYDVGYIDTKRIAYDSDEQAWYYSEREYEVGGGGSTLLVTITENGSQWICDKTWADINLAFGSGSSVLVALPSGGALSGLCAVISCLEGHDMVDEYRVTIRIGADQEPVDLITSSESGYPSIDWS